ncbi:MAG: hypothetical protein HC930_15545 [Hydrococcus sp. SU_1_0]|nr:hypothetical protein [Hydrococcus sp. SU_1_0]
MKEIYAGGGYYGIGKIIKEYAIFPDFLPLPVSIQHGWANITHVHDACSGSPENWFWTESIAIKYQNEFKGLNIRVVGAPFLYLLTHLNYVEPIEKEGSIVFPAHSSKLIKVECDFDKYADMLEELSDEYKPITICMYYLDIERGLDIPFRRKGFEIIKNGDSLYDVNFLKQFINNTHGKKYAFSNQTTSALLFASVMGLVSFFYGPKVTLDSSDPDDNSLDYSEDIRNWEQQWLRSFRFPDYNIQNQREFTCNELGGSFLLSPKEMNKILYKSAFSAKYFYSLLRRVVKDFLTAYIPSIYQQYTRYRDRNL